jgi:RNA polymerase sigma factor (sigma-70 family)
MTRERKLIELYEFAIRYARSFHSAFIEADDLAQEMMLAVMKTRWKSDAYATTVMKNRFLDLARRGKLERGYYAPFDSPEVQRVCSNDYTYVNLTIEGALKALPKRQSQILKHVLQGRSTCEIRRCERVSAKTVYRCIARSRELLAV